MAIVNAIDLINHAYRHRYALGILPIESLTALTATLITAQAQRSPVALMAAASDELSFRALMCACEAAARNATVPVAIIGAARSEAELITRDINFGCNAILVKPNTHEFPGALSQTKLLATAPMQCGIAMGAELPIAPNGANLDTQSALTPVAEGVAFAERANLNFLQVRIGTEPNVSASRTKIDFDRLKRINEAAKLPLMISAGSPLSNEQARRLTENGVALVQHVLSEETFDVNSLAENFRIWGSAGRSAEVFEQAGSWQSIEHVIEFNVQEDAHDNLLDVLETGRAQLETIPGVRRAIAGKAVTTNAKYQYCWIITLAHRTVIDYYRNHPVQVEYAEKLFQPIATDRCTIDFEH